MGAGSVREHLFAAAVAVVVCAAIVWPLWVWADHVSEGLAVMACMYGAPDPHSCVGMFR